MMLYSILFIKHRDIYTREELAYTHAVHHVYKQQASLFMYCILFLTQQPKLLLLAICSGTIYSYNLTYTCSYTYRYSYVRAYILFAWTWCPTGVMFNLVVTNVAMSFVANPRFQLMCAEYMGSLPYSYHRRLKWKSVHLSHPPWVCLYIHTCIHKHRYTRLCTHMHTCKHSYMCTHTHFQYYSKKA